MATRTARNRPAAIVREIIAGSPAFGSLPRERRRRLLRNAERVARDLADPDGLLSAEARTPLLDDAPTHATAVEWLVDAVDFPEFVAGLLHGVFDAIVDASIEQMDAYGELLASVAESLDERPPLDHRAAVDWLAVRFPGLVDGDAKSGSVATDCLRFADAVRAIGGNERVRTRRQLVAATRRHLAKQRQQLLATTILMGVTRAVAGSDPARPAGAANGIGTWSAPGTHREPQPATTTASVAATLTRR